MVDRTEVIDSIAETIGTLSGDWEYNGPITSETRLIADLAMRSLDVVVLSSAMVRKYGLIPFTELYAELEAMPPEDRDMTIGGFADFVCKHATVAPAARPGATSAT